MSGGWYAFTASANVPFYFIHSNNVAVLYISNVLQVLGKEPTSKEFQNLKNLLLTHCYLSDDCILVFFLRCSPNLERLTLRHCKVYFSLVFSFLLRNQHSSSSYIFLCCPQLLDDTEVKPVLKLKMTDFLRENLKILYKERYSRKVIEFMKRVSGYRLENFI